VTGTGSPVTTDTALLDVDGTLVDSNYQHVLAWQRAFREHGMSIGAWRIHRHLGMGGDQLVPALVGEDAERERGDDLRACWRKHVDPLLDQVQPLEGATELIQALRDLGLTVVLASSGPAEHVERYVDLVRARDLAEAWTTADDVGTTKPAPDLLEVALEKGGGSSAVIVGDSTWDCEASRRLGAECIAVRTGGFGRDELLAAGARDVYDSLPDLTSALTRGRIRV
jgi:HAD superfamily hydrolase (TIGR01549 family)